MIVHKTSKKHKIKRKLNFKYMSSCELKTSKFSLVLRTRKNADVFNTLDEKKIGIHPKKANFLYLFMAFAYSSRLVHILFNNVVQ